MPITQIAFAAGFASVRQFNDTISRGVRIVADRSPRQSPAERRWGHARAAPAVSRAVSHRGIFGFLGARAVPGIETWDGTTYRRSMRLNHGNAVVAVAPGPNSPGANALMCTLHLDNVADAQAAVQRCRRLFDLDADPNTVEAHFADDTVLGPLVRKRPGLRSPGHPDGVELLTRAILGQPVSVKGARTLATRLVLAIGEPLAAPDDARGNGVTHVFPSAAAIAGCTPADFAMPTARGRALIHVRATRIRRHRDRRRQRSRRDPSSTRGAAGDPAVDGELRVAASTGRSRCVPADRHRCAQRAARHRCRVESEGRITACRDVETVEVIRCITCGPVCD